jgi:lamin tail-like protein
VPDMTMEGVAMDRDGFLYVVNENGGGDPSHPQLWVYARSDAPNLPPTAVSLNNAVASLPENTSTAAPIKLAEIVVADDGLGNNTLSLTGADAGFMQIIGAGLYLKAGTALSATTKPAYSITVNVDDTEVGISPDASVDYTLTIDPPTGGTPALIISEVAPWSSGNSPAALRVDWFEVTNIGTATAFINGWKMDDSSNSFGSGVTLNNVSSIAPGESVIFMETTDANLPAKRTAFLSTWFGTNPPASLQIGNYTGAGVGLSTDPGDAVNLFDGTGALQANVVFGLSPTGPFSTFDNAAGLNNTTISLLSAVGINGAFVAAEDVNEIGSPGTIGAIAAPVVNISATDPDASEAGTDPGTFHITRTGSMVGVLTVNYTIGAGTGQAGAGDYAPELTGVATIQAGQSFVDVTITPVDDSEFEGTETLTLTLFDTGSYDVGDSPTSTVSLADNDPPDTTITSSPSTPTNSTSAHFAFSGSQPVSVLAGFECALDGAAFAACSSPVDYNGLTEGSHTFAVRAVDIFGRQDPTPASFTWLIVAGSIVHVTANGSDGPVTLAPGAPLRIDIEVDTPGAGLSNSNVAFGVLTPFGLFWLGSAGFTTTPVTLYSGPLVDFGPVPIRDFASTTPFPPGSYYWFLLVQDAASGALRLGSVQTIVP